jgi:hypothetical protein
MMRTIAAMSRAFRDLGSGEMSERMLIVVKEE